MSKPDVERLVAARELIARPGGWTQGAFARDFLGHVIICTAPRACSFCAQGALYAVGASNIERWAVCDAVGYNQGNISGWNDNPDQTQGGVVAGFDRAIEVARSAQ